MKAGHRGFSLASKSLLSFVAAAIAFLGAVGTWILSAPWPSFPLHHSMVLADGAASRGKRIFDAADCASCHASPGQDDRLKLGGGLALDSRYGTFTAPNISPHPTDGIGRWTAADLANALLSGLSPDGAHYFPVFPYPAFAHMQLDDVQDLMGYLRTLPVSGRPPPHEVSFPLNIRRGVGLWKLLFFDPSSLPEDPSRSGDWNHGRSLVEALGHCAECHSTRNLLGAVKPSTRFAGGPDPSNVGYVPNITPRGIGRWSQAQISDFLATGIGPDLRGAGSSMAEMVRDTAS